VVGAKAKRQLRLKNHFDESALKQMNNNSHYVSIQNLLTFIHNVRRWHGKPKISNNALFNNKYYALFQSLPKTRNKLIPIALNLRLPNGYTKEKFKLALSSPGTPINVIQQYIAEGGGTNGLKAAQKPENASLLELKEIAAREYHEYIGLITPNRMSRNAIKF
jgi:hypothetical protein